MWQRPELGVYVLFSGPLPPVTRMWIAVLRAGSGAVLSHRSAAVASGLIETLPGRVEVTVPAGRRVRGVLRETEVRRCVDLSLRVHPVLSPPQTRVEHTVLDLSDDASTERKVVGWVTASVQTGLTTAERLRSALETRARVSWRGLLTALLADVGSGTHSPLEHHHRVHVHRAHGLPDGRRQHRSGALGPVWVDVDLEEHGLVVELDGRLGHEGDGRFRDRRRDNRNTVRGCVTLRYGHAEVFGEPCAVAAETVEVLRDRGWRGEPKPCGPSCSVNERPLKASRR